MVPSKFPKLKASDVLVGSDEYEQDGKRTTVGWLKYLFLFNTFTENGDEYLNITAADTKDYASAIDRFKIVNKITRSVSLEFWEDDQSATKQANALNKFFTQENKDARNRQVQTKQRKSKSRSKG